MLNYQRVPLHWGFPLCQAWPPPGLACGGSFDAVGPSASGLRMESWRCTKGCLCNMYIIYIYIHKHIYICIYIYICVCVCVCTYVYRHLKKIRWWWWWWQRMTTIESAHHPVVVPLFWWTRCTVSRCTDFGCHGYFTQSHLSILAKTCMFWCIYSIYIYAYIHGYAYILCTYIYIYIYIYICTCRHDKYVYMYIYIYIYWIPPAIENVQKWGFDQAPRCSYYWQITEIGS